MADKANVQVLNQADLSQLAIVRKARSRGLSRAYFAAAREKLSISDSIIY